MILSRANNPVLHFEDEHGHPLAGGFLCTYVANTSTPVATYGDDSGTKNPVRIPLDSRGECTVWLDPAQAYKFVLIDKHGNVLMTADNVTADTMTFVAQGDDIVDVVEETVDGKTVIRFSIKPHSIGRELLKGARDLVVDEQHLKMRRMGEDVVLSLSDKLAKDLAESGYDVDDTGVDIADVNGLQAALNGKSDVGHTHTIGNVQGLGDALGAKYEKPAGGVPKEDLAAGVKDSLGKADSALQRSDVASVAISGSYNDLSNKPTIPPAVTIDSAMSSTSTNPVQNKVVNTALSYKQNWQGDYRIANSSGWWNVGTVYFKSSCDGSGVLEISGNSGFNIEFHAVLTLGGYSSGILVFDVWTRHSGANAVDVSDRIKVWLIPNKTTYETNCYDVAINFKADPRAKINWVLGEQVLSKGSATRLSNAPDLTDAIEIPNRIVATVTDTANGAGSSSVPVYVDREGRIKNCGYDLADMASKAYVDGIVGNINELLEAI